MTQVSELYAHVIGVDTHAATQAATHAFAVVRAATGALVDQAAARAAIAYDESSLITPRSEGIASALRVLLVARKAIDTRRTADRNTLTALVRTYGAGCRRPQVPHGCPSA